jgi:5-methylcytosine-specific restriction endonuclease McrA
MSVKLCKETVEKMLLEKGLFLIGEYIEYNTPIEVTTADGYKAMTRINTIKKGYMPSFYDIRNPFTIPNIENWLKDNAQNYKLVSSKFEGNSSKLLFQDIKNEYPPFKKTFNEFKQSPRHPDQGYIIRDASRRNSKDKLIKEINSLLETNEKYIGWSSEVDSLDFYENTTSKIYFKHIDEYKTYSSLGNLRRGDYIEIFNSKKQEDSTQNMYIFMKKYKKNIILLPNQKYTGTHTSYKFSCSKHKDFSTSFKVMLNSVVGCHKCYLESLKGEGHPRWDSTKTEEERQDDRSNYEYDEFRRNVFIRDNFTCQCCGDNSGGNLVVHHKDAYHWCKERRCDIDNGITLCDNCHTSNEFSFHKIYGRNKNTESQFNDWLLIYSDKLKKNGCV